MSEIAEFTRHIGHYLPPPDVALVERAFAFSEHAHQGQFRKSGEPYITHPLAVASILTAVTRGLNASIEEGLQIESKQFARVAPTHDLREGLDAWMARQVYIALGEFITAAALLGVDTCPMEGIEAPKFDEILGLTAMVYGALCACAAGYRAADDKYAKLPKVRFKPQDVIVHV